LVEQVPVLVHVSELFDPHADHRSEILVEPLGHSEPELKSAIAKI